MKKLITVLLFAILACSISFAQGVFNSTASADWTLATTWTLVSGTDADGVPDADDDVTILSTPHAVNINDDVACNNLTFQAGSDIFFNTANKSLTVNGNIGGASTSEDYTSGTNASGTKLIIAGTGAQSTSANSGGASTNWPDVDVNKVSGTITLGQNVRIDGNLAILVGTMDAGGRAISMAATSNITVAASCSLLNVDRVAQTTGGTGKNNAITIDGLFSSSTSASSINTVTLTINSGAILDMRGSATGFSNTAGSENPTNMLCANGSTVKYSGTGQTGRFVNYFNLELSGGAAAGSAIKTISAVGTLTVNNNLTISNGARFLGGGNYIVTGTTNINDNGEILWNGGTGSTFTFNGPLNINGNSSNGAIRFGGASTTTPAYTLNGDVTVSAATTASAFNLNSGTTGVANRTFEGIINFNGNVYTANLSTLTSVSTTDPPSTNINFGGSNKVLSITTGSSSFINLRGDVTFATSRTIQCNPGTAFQFTTRPNSVSPEWTIKIDNGQTVTIASGAIVNLPNRSFADGTGAGNLQIDGELRIGLLGGWNSAITNTGITNLGSASTITFNGSTGQVTGNLLPPSALVNLTINNFGNVTLSSSISITGNLTLTNGRFILTSNNLTLGATSVVNGTLNSNNMVQVDGSGELRKTFTSPGSFTYPVGDNTGGVPEYSPVTLNFTSGSFSSAYAGVKLVDAIHPTPLLPPTDYITRYWTVTSSGISSFSCGATFTYVDADISGNENNLYLLKYDSPNWSPLAIGNPAANQLSGTITSFSDFWGANEGAGPVELSALNAFVNNNSVGLTWKTLSETNSSAFQVQRKSENANWTNIGEVAAAGNSNSPKDYSFTDKSLASGKYQYRLKMIDADGSYQYSNIVNAEITLPKEFSLSQNYPNPFNPSTQISYSLPFDTDVRLDIYSVNGELVRSLVNEKQSAGNYTLQFDASGFASGTYIYRIITKDFVQSKKMILAK